MERERLADRPDRQHLGPGLGHPDGTWELQGDDHRKDASGKTGTATFVWKITHGAECTGQLIQNPGFESGAQDWAESSPQIIGKWGSDEATHSGSGEAWLSGYGRSRTDTLSQTIKVPAGCSTELSYYLHVDTDEHGSTAYDKLQVRAGSTTLATHSNTDAAKGYTKHTVDLSAYAGKTVKITFTGTEDVALQTSFVLDDVTADLS